ncbi:type VI secretion system protein TssA [Comamonas testosteroni]|uniref:type VI secretion system protein TssA n=1 Tax=Comamonas testosteroni TaxID=285 RepID=UPI0009B65885|nr:type VI secretion system protein TssA [Comamonas testosteroni]
MTLFDLNDLLRPVTSEDPRGTDMPLSTEFDEIQSALQQEDPSLDQGEWITARKEADLPFVTRRCIQLLQEQTKDLRLAIWLTDAVASQHGLPGLTHGYALLDALAARYGHSLHPQPEDWRYGARIGNISWFLKRSVEQLGNAPLLQSGSIRINMLAWQAAVALDQAVRRHPCEAHEIVKGRTTLEELERQRSSVPDSSLKVLAAQLAQFRAASKSLEDTLNDRLGDEAPSLAAIWAALEDLQHLARRWGANDEPVQLPTADEAAADSAPFENAARVAAPTESEHRQHSTALVRTRADAIALLEQVAASLEHTEPSSPEGRMLGPMATA